VRTHLRTNREEWGTLKFKLTADLHSSSLILAGYSKGFFQILAEDGRGVFAESAVFGAEGGQEVAVDV
jgi:hypothetical protein